MPPWAQAVVWAALKLNDALDLDLTDGQIAALVTKSGSVENPCKRAVKKWRDIFKEDPDWWPNKTQEERKNPGPKRLCTEAKDEAMRIRNRTYCS